MNESFNFQSIRAEISLPSRGSDYNTYDISKDVVKFFGDEIKYDQNNTYIFYPHYSDGAVGLLYYFNTKLGVQKSEVTFFGWGTDSVGNGFWKPNFYLFTGDKITTSIEKAEEQMMKEVLLRKWGIIHS